jgi:hypothetical protein
VPLKLQNFGVSEKEKGSPNDSTFRRSSYTNVVGRQNSQFSLSQIRV